MDNNDFGQNYTYDRGTYYSTPGWNDFTLDDERQAKRRFSRFFLGIFLYILISNAAAIVIATVLSLLLGEKYDALINSSWFELTFNAVVMYAIALPIFYLIVKGMKKTVRVHRSMSFGEIFKLLLVSEAFMYVGNLVGQYINLIVGSMFGLIPSNSTIDMVTESNIFVVFIVAVVLGPIAEELIFRKLLMDRLGMYGDRVAIFVSAIAFALFHGNFYQLFYAFLLGLVLSYAYSKTGNIWYPIVIHMAINFIGSIIPMLLADGLVKLDELSQLMTVNEQMSEEMMAKFLDPSVLLASLYLPLNLAMVIAGTVIFFKQRKRVFVSDRCEICIPKERRKTVIFGNAGVILFLVLCGLTIIANFVLPVIEAFLAAASNQTPNITPPPTTTPPTSI